MLTLTDLKHLLPNGQREFDCHLMPFTLEPR